MMLFISSDRGSGRSALFGQSSPHARQLCFDLEHSGAGFNALLRLQFGLHSFAQFSEPDGSKIAAARLEFVYGA